MTSGGGGAAARPGARRGAERGVKRGDGDSRLVDVVVAQWSAIVAHVDASVLRGHWPSGAGAEPERSPLVPAGEPGLGAPGLVPDVADLPDLRRMPDRSNAPPGWTTADPLSRVARSATALAEALSRPPPPVAEITATGYLLGTGAQAGTAPVPGRPGAGGGPGPADALRSAVAAAVAALDRVPAAAVADRVVATGGGAMLLGEYLRTRAVDAVVCGLDLGVAPVRAALRVAVRLLTAVLAEQVPGRAVELRVPPFAAVQIVEGPRHTRGTPPNVVEADPEAFTLLATGRLAWADAVADGRVRASGERADLRSLLPVGALSRSVETL